MGAKVRPQQRAGGDKEGLVFDLSLWAYARTGTRVIVLAVINGLCEDKRRFSPRRAKSRITRSQAAPCPFQFWRVRQAPARSRLIEAD